MNFDLSNKACHLVYRCSAAERELTRIHAMKMGLTVSAYVRQSLLFMIMLEGSPDEVKEAMVQLGAEAMPMIKNRLRYLDSL